MTKIITVLGALGAQGGSVVKSLLQDETSFKIRAVTRSINSDAANNLKKLGVDVVAGNVKEPSTLAAAFQGADAAFIVVNFWDPDILTKELELTKEILDVAKEAHVKQIILSSLADVEAVSGGKIDVPHFTMKAKSLQYAKSLGFEYVTGVEPAFYYSSWFVFFKPTTEEDGSLTWKYPGKNKISQYDSVTGTGPAVLCAVKDADKYNGKFLLLQGDYLTPEESINLISKKIGKPARVEYIEPKTFATFFTGAQEIAEMVKWFDEFGYFGPETHERKWESGKEATGKLMSLEEWLDTKAYEKFPL